MTFFENCDVLRLRDNARKPLYCLLVCLLGGLPASNIWAVGIAVHSYDFALSICLYIMSKLASYSLQFISSYE